MKYFVELLATFLLVLTIVLAIHLIPKVSSWCVGFVLVALVYGGARTSGAHYNPAVSLALWIRIGSGGRTVLGYILAQCAGASAAAYFGIFLLKYLKVPLIIANTGTLSFNHGFWPEFVGTLALILVIFMVATWNRTKGNRYYGLAIGGIVAICAFFLGAETFGAFNPAVALAFGLSEMTPWSNLWIYLLAQISAALVSGKFFEILPDSDWKNSSDE